MNQMSNQIKKVNDSVEKIEAFEKRSQEDQKQIEILENRLKELSEKVKFCEGKTKEVERISREYQSRREEILECVMKWFSQKYPSIQETILDYVIQHTEIQTESGFWGGLKVVSRTLQKR